MDVSEYVNALAKLKRARMTRRANKTAPAMQRRIAKYLPVAQGRVIVIEGSYRDQSPDITATWFIDPPYQSTSTHPNARGKGYAYGCNSDAVDYDHLSRFCRTRRDHVIVCEQPEARWLPFNGHFDGGCTINTQTQEGVWEMRTGLHMQPRLNGHSVVKVSTQTAAPG